MKPKGQQPSPKGTSGDITRARGHAHLLPGFLRSHRSVPSSTPQPTRWCHDMEMGISIMQPTGMRNGGMEPAPKPRSPSLFPSKPCSVPSLPERSQRGPFPEAAAEAGSKRQQEPGNAFPKYLVQLCWQMMAATCRLHVVGFIS